MGSTARTALLDAYAPDTIVDGTASPGRPTGIGRSPGGAGACTAISDARAITMDGPKSVTATFDLEP